MVYNSKLIDFFKRHNLYDEEMFNYFQNNSIMVDYMLEESHDIIGTYYIFSKNNKLKSLYLVIPYLYDERTMLISIHEIVHAICIYNRLNKSLLIDESIEILPMLYEKIYVLESKSKKAEQFLNYLDSRIRNNEKYILAFSLRNQLVERYEYDFTKISKEAKKLLRKKNRKI